MSSQPRLFRVHKPTDSGPIPDAFSRCHCCGAPLAKWSGEDSEGRAWGRDCYLRAIGRPKLRTLRAKAADALMRQIEHDAEQALIAHLLATVPRGELLIYGRACYGFRYGDHVIIPAEGAWGYVRYPTIASPETLAKMAPLAAYLDAYATRTDLSESGRASEREKTRAFYAVRGFV